MLKQEKLKAQLNVMFLKASCIKKTNHTFSHHLLPFSPLIALTCCIDFTLSSMVWHQAAIVQKSACKVVIDGRLLYYYREIVVVLVENWHHAVKEAIAISDLLDGI